jgi:hypothetical protein
MARDVKVNGERGGSDPVTANLEPGGGEGSGGPTGVKRRAQAAWARQHAGAAEAGGGQ